jgi:hypothetical protein
MDKFGPLGAIGGNVTLFDAPEESMVIATPFDKPGHFYFNQKINCMRARRQRSAYGGRDLYLSTPPRALPCWTGAGACGRITTPGTGARPPIRSAACPSAGTSATASETPPPPRKTCSSMTESAHKLGNVQFHIPGGEKDFMSPWRFSSDDGRFEMDFRPPCWTASPAPM